MLGLRSKFCDVFSYGSCPVGEFDPHNPGKTLERHATWNLKRMNVGTPGYRHVRGSAQGEFLQFREGPKQTIIPILLGNRLSNQYHNPFTCTSFIFP